MTSSNIMTAKQIYRRVSRRAEDAEESWTSSYFGNGILISGYRFISRKPSSNPIVRPILCRQTAIVSGLPLAPDDNVHGSDGAIRSVAPGDCSQADPFSGLRTRLRTFSDFGHA